jgi:hypothetical protein
MRKLHFNFPVQSIIEANLNLQTIQRTLSKEYKIYSPKLETLVSDKFISMYKTWGEKRKEDFVKTIAGKLNFKKVKNFFDEKIGETNE